MPGSSGSAPSRRPWASCSAASSARSRPSQLAPDGDPTGYSLLGAAAAYGLLAATVFTRRRDLSTVLWAVGLAFALASAAVLLTGTALVAALAGAAAVLAALAAWTGEGRFQVPSLTLLVLALGYTLVDVAPPADLFAVNAHPAEGAPAVFLAAAAALVLALLAGGPIGCGRTTASTRGCRSSSRRCGPEPRGPPA